MFSPLCFGLPFLNSGVNNLDAVLKPVINEVIRVTCKIMVSVLIYLSHKA